MDPLLNALVSLEGFAGGFGLLDWFDEADCFSVLLVSAMPLVRGVVGERGGAGALLLVLVVAVLTGGGGGGGGGRFRFSDISKESRLIWRIFHCKISFPSMRVACSANKMLDCES